MTRVKLEVVRNLDVENDCGLCIESCSAYYTSEEQSIKIIGEITAKKKISDYVEVQVVVYDMDGELMAREYCNWRSFGLLQSFDLESDLSGFEQTPKKVKIYPSKS